MENMKEYRKEQLKNWIERLVENNGYNDDQKNCLIQFTVFILIDVKQEPAYMFGIKSDEKIDVEEWYMQCAIGGTREEGIYDLNVECNDELLIEVSSHKCNYESFIFDSINDINFNIADEFIVAADLYDNFNHKLYKGNICTRGGYTSWNYIDIQIINPGG